MRVDTPQIYRPMRARRWEGARNYTHKQLSQLRANNASRDAASPIVGTVRTPFTGAEPVGDIRPPAPPPPSQIDRGVARHAISAGGSKYQTVEGPRSEGFKPPDRAPDELRRKAPGGYAYTKPQSDAILRGEALYDVTEEDPDL